MSAQPKNYLSRFFNSLANKNMAAIFLGGVSNGLPGVLTWQTLNIWLYDLGYSKTCIGMMFLCSLPYTIKFLLSPLVEQFHIPFLYQSFGKRRSWAICMQLGMLLCLLGIGTVTSANSLALTALLCLLTSLCSSLNQIATVAHRIELLDYDLTAQGVAVGITGYRLGKLLGRAGALYLMTLLPWSWIYFTLSTTLILSMTFYIIADEPQEQLPCVASYDLQAQNSTDKTDPPSPSSQTWIDYWRSTFIYPFLCFKNKFQHWKLYLALIFLINISDDLIVSMSDLFFLEIGFTPYQIAHITKIFGLFCSLAGGFIAARACMSINLFDTIFIASLLHVASHLLLLCLCGTGPYTPLLILTVAIEYLSSGMKAALLATLISHFCKVSPYTGTQYAFFSSLKAIPLLVLSSISGYLKDHLLWSQFFLIGILLSLPVLFLIAHLRTQESQTPLSLSPTPPEAPSPSH